MTASDDFVRALAHAHTQHVIDAIQIPSMGTDEATAYIKYVIANLQQFLEGLEEDP